MPRGRAQSGWTLLVGILLVLSGLAFLLVPLLSTLAAGVATGALLLVAGVVQSFHAVGERGRGWGWALTVGLLAGVTGVLLLRDPLSGVIGFTLLLGIYLLISGGAKVGMAGLWAPASGWGWMLFNGLLTLLLGVLVLAGWPATGLWTVGVFLGVDLLLAGFARIVYALTDIGETAGPMIPTR